MGRPGRVAAKKTKLSGPDHRLHPGAHAKRLAGLGQVPFYGATGNAEDLADYPGALALLDPVEALQLSLCEAGWPRAVSGMGSRARTPRHTRYPCHAPEAPTAGRGKYSENSGIMPGVPAGARKSTWPQFLGGNPTEHLRETRKFLAARGARTLFSTFASGRSRRARLKAEQRYLSSDEDGGGVMPEVIVRKRVARRRGNWKYRLNRWFYRHRPQVAVAAAFVAACLVGLIAASIGTEVVGSHSDAADAPAPPATP